MTLRSKIKVPWRSLRYATHRLMVMHPHTKYWPISKETIIWPWGQRSRSHEGHYGTWHRLMVMHPHTKYHWPISKDKNVMARTRKYYLKNHHLTLRSKVKVHEGHYGTWHCLMVMHPHIKYHWPIWKDKRVMVRTSFTEKKQKKRKKKSDKNNMSPFVRRGDIISTDCTGSYKSNYHTITTTGGRLNLRFSVVLCRSLSFFLWSLCCLFFLDLRLLISPLVSSNFS